MIHLDRWRFRLALPLLGLLLAAGCRTAAPVPPDTAEERIPVREFARRLGLVLVERSDAHATLRDGVNTVVVFAHPARWIYVNGRRLGPLSGATRAESDFLVPAEVVGRVRTELAPVRPPRPPPPSPTARPPLPTPESPPPAEKPPPPAPRDLLGKSLVLDPGHGGRDSGAISVLGFSEKTVNLSVCVKLAKLLRQRGAEVALTRSSDTWLSLDARARKANVAGPGLFVSIHADSAGRSSARGYTVYIARKASTRSVRAADSIITALAGTGLASRGVKRAGFNVLVETSCPAVLVEMGFVSNPADAALLRDAAFKDRLAEALARGIGIALLAQ